jgi:putative peptidoglycan lipid II flippase
VEIRAASSANQDVKSAQLIGSATLANGHTEIKLAAMQPTRYILVWITTLAGGGSNNGSGIGEITYHQTK